MSKETGAITSFSFFRTKTGNKNTPKNVFKSWKKRQTRKHARISTQVDIASYLFLFFSLPFTADAVLVKGNPETSSRVAPETLRRLFLSRHQDQGINFLTWLQYPKNKTETFYLFVFRYLRHFAVYAASICHAFLVVFVFFSFLCTFART